jgi:mono/diheme cytochrome c family protein
VRRFALIALVLLLPVIAIGCGGSEEDTAPETVEGEVPQAEEGEGDGGAASGEEIFASQGCGNCHVLEAAGSSGTVGPNLDDAQPTVDEAVKQVTQGGGGMPAFEGKLSETEIQAVAEYVSESAGG